YILQPKYLSPEKDATEQSVSVSALLSSLADRGEGYPHRLWKLFEDRYSPHDPVLLRLLGLTAQQISAVFQFLHSTLTRQVEAYYGDFRNTMDEPLRIRQDWESGRLSDAQMLELSAKVR